MLSPCLRYVPQDASPPKMGTSLHGNRSRHHLGHNGRCVSLSNISDMSLSRPFHTLHSTSRGLFSVPCKVHRFLQIVNYPFPLFPFSIPVFLFLSCIRSLHLFTLINKCPGCPLQFKTRDVYPSTRVQSSATRPSSHLHQPATTSSRNL